VKELNPGLQVNDDELGGESLNFRVTGDKPIEFAGRRLDQELHEYNVP
jgi:hypothetical protein